jgi:predicted N-acetyltransferase YhbS
MDYAFDIVPELPLHADARESLLDNAMGPIRFRRASQRLRDGRMPALSHVAMDGDAVIGTVRLWAVRACGLSGALLLGPMAVEKDYRGRGVGRALIETALSCAAEAGHGAVVLVGDAPYYGRFGFNAHAARRLAMPGPFERHRLLALALRPGALDRAHGVLRPLVEIPVPAGMLASAA